MGAGLAGPGAPAYTVTLIYDDNFTIDRAATIAGNTPFPADGVGNTKVFNHAASYIGSGLFNMPTFAAMVIDAAAKRTRAFGRIHVAKFDVPATSDFQQCLMSLVGEASGDGNWWALNEGEPGILVKTGGTKGDLRNCTLTTQGNYQWQQAMSASHTYEWALIERDGAGSFSLIREDGGDWRMIAFEKHTTLAGKIHWRNSGSGFPSLDRLSTADTSFSPVPLVQHSFASAVTPSDGAGQLTAEATLGASIVGTSSGDITITASALQMDSDGEGFVFYETGETEVACSADFTVYDGSRCGMVVRAVDASNYIAVVVNSTANTISIIEVVAGSPATLASVDSNASPDFYDLADATAIRLRVHIDGDVIRASYSDGVGGNLLHLGYAETSTTRFASATKAGVLVSKGAAVNSSKASNFVVFAQVQNDLPAMTNT